MKFIKKYLVLIVIFLSFLVPAYAGVHSEIDILVREVALSNLLPGLSQSENYDLFSKIQLSVAEENFKDCTLTIDGNIPMKNQKVKFVACVKVINQGEDIQVRILDSLFIPQAQHNF